jgi:hypothetical protein
MRPFVFSWALSLAVTFGVGCGDGRPPGTAGNDSSLVGGPCMNNTECDERLCQMGDRFPGGVCTISCGSSGHCPQRSSCAELSSGWICLVDCTTGTDCRTGWGCESVPEAGTNGSLVSVCIGPESAP